MVTFLHSLRALASRTLAERKATSFYGNCFFLVWRYLSRDGRADSRWFVACVSIQCTSHQYSLISHTSHDQCGNIGNCRMVRHAQRTPYITPHGDVLRLLCTLSVVITVHGLWFFVTESIMRVSASTPWHVYPSHIDIIANSFGSIAGRSM